MSMNVTPERDSVWTALTVPSTVTVSPTCLGASAAAMTVCAWAEAAARTRTKAKTSARMVCLRNSEDHSKPARRGLRRHAPAFVSHGVPCYPQHAFFGGRTMPDALNLLATRRSFKAVELAGPAPSAAEIDTLLTIASRVPDHGKLTPWRFIVFEGEARRSAGAAIATAFRAKYPDAKPEHVAAERERLARAPLVIAVVSR